MAKLGDITVHIRMKVSISFWDALKLRLSGAGHALRHWIEVEIEERKDDAAERDRALS